MLRSLPFAMTGGSCHGGLGLATGAAPPRRIGDGCGPARRIGGSDGGDASIGDSDGVTLRVVASFGLRLRIGGARRRRLQRRRYPGACPDLGRLQEDSVASAAAPVGMRQSALPP
jgi:hypothetical protein